MFGSRCSRRRFAGSRHPVAALLAVVAIGVVLFGVPAAARLAPGPADPSGPSGATAAASAAPGAVVTYRPPVVGTVAEGFHAPASPFAPGNRGLDYRVEPGEPVTAASAGTVVFAGPVPGGLAVTVQHPDGVRTALTGLGTLAVGAGDTVTAGQVVGTTAAGRLFFSARIGDAYVDPAQLLDGGGRPRIHLVPTPPP
jgi:murein DD-endopeptidase MepM/ murein hydrolase activator NlpD